jgi:hypothetical protein
MKALSIALLCSVLLGQSGPPAEDPSHDARQYRRQALAFYKAKDYAAALQNFKKAAELIPDHPSIIYNIAAMQALLGNERDAIAELSRTAEMGLALHPERDADFNSIKDREPFKALLKRFAANTAPLVRSEVAFRLTEKGLITEGIAYDPTEQVFYISSIHRRRIVWRDRNGATGVLSAPEAEIWSVLGMKVDGARRILWATTTAFPQMSGFSRDLEGQSAILKFDLRTRRLLKKYPVPSGRKHGLGDLAIDRRGDVFATDSDSAAIYVVRHDKNEIELLLDGAPFISPQGLAFSDDEKHLFVADYGKGIFDVDVATRRVTHLAPAPRSTSLGIDGLYFHGGALIGIQNGVTPNRIVRLVPSADSRRIDKFEVLEANNPMFDEPTLGVIVKSELYFIANSQWQNVDEKGKLAADDKLKEPLVLKLRLPPR